MFYAAAMDVFGSSFIYIWTSGSKQSWIGHNLRIVVLKELSSLNCRLLCEQCAVMSLLSPIIIREFDWPCMDIGHFHTCYFSMIFDSGVRVWPLAGSASRTIIEIQQA